MTGGGLSLSGPVQQKAKEKQRVAQRERDPVLGPNSQLGVAI